MTIPCKSCGQPCSVLISRSPKNPNKKFWGCSSCPKESSFNGFIPPGHNDLAIEPKNANRDKSPVRQHRGDEYTQYGSHHTQPQQPPQQGYPQQNYQQPQQPLQPQPTQPPLEARGFGSSDTHSFHQKLNLIEGNQKNHFHWLQTTIQGLVTMIGNLQKEVGELKAASSGSLNVVPMSDFQGEY